MLSQGLALDADSRLEKLACGGSEEGGRRVFMAQRNASERGQGVGRGNGLIPVKERKLGSVEKMGLCPYVHLNLHVEKPILLSC